MLKYIGANEGVEVLPMVKEMKGIDSFDFSTRIEKELQIAKSDLKTGLKKLSIIIDHDNDSIENRISFLNKMVHSVFGKENSLSTTSDSIYINVDTFQIDISCFFIGVDGVGELSTLLKAIKCTSSTYSDCLENWWQCADPEKKVIDQVEFDKSWYHYYIKWDNSTHQERQQAGKYCTLLYSLEEKGHIWNLDSEYLTKLNSYLKTMI